MRTFAPFAPAHLIGLGDASPAPTPYPDQSYDIPYDIVLTANQQLLDSKPIERDADFVWRAIVIAAATSQLFKVQFDVNGRDRLSPSQILAANYQSDPSSPYALWPEWTVPAGGRIGIFITDLSGAGNTIEIVFRGCKRTPAQAQ